MRKTRSWMVALLGAALALPALGQEAFDACEVFTVQDAQAAMGVTALAEAANPKVKRPKVVQRCTYNGVKDGKPVQAVVDFKFGRSENDVKASFSEHRLQVQTKPIIVAGAEMFWSAKTGQMNLRKDRTWVQIAVGPAKPTDRDPEQAKRAADAILKKL